MSLVGRRYAQALVEFSFQKENADGFKKGFDTLINVYNKEEKFRGFLLNPQVKVDQKKELIKKLYKDDRKELANLLMYLLDKGRMKNLPEIYREYVILADKRKNVLNMKVFSAKQLESKQLKAIEEKYKKSYNAVAVNIESSIDASLIGGIKVVIGDKEIDNTVKGKLKELKEVLIKR